MSSPILRSLRKRTLLSFMPNFIATRYSPINTPSTYFAEGKEPVQSSNSVLISSDHRDMGLSAVLAVVIERKMRPMVRRLLPKMGRIGLTISLAALTVSLLEYSKSIRATRFRLRLVPAFWALLSVYFLSVSRGQVDQKGNNPSNRYTFRKLLRLIQSQIFGIEDTHGSYDRNGKLVTVDAADMNNDVHPMQVSSIHWELCMCSCVDIGNIK